MNIEYSRKLLSPYEVKKMYPLSANGIMVKENYDSEIKNVFTGLSDKFLVIIGPCSVDSEISIKEYITKLCNVNEYLKDKITLIPRIYTAKPRTNGGGFKGILHNPTSYENEDLYNGIILSRKLHQFILEKYGISTADEILYTDIYEYLSDVLSYTTIGARTVESQQHRFIASALDIPVGMKNPTSGNLDIMLNAIHTAHQSHSFIYNGWEVVTKGNPLAHAVLRGGFYGERYIPNYNYESLLELCEKFKEYKITNGTCIIDVNHSNSAKRYEEQFRIVNDVINSKKLNSSINKMVKGVMIESYLLDGKCDFKNKVYGQSVTDACIGWQTTEKLLFEIAESI